ncbi:MAG: excisionase family DNA-binding protein [Chitinophagales bacterium]
MPLETELSTQQAADMLNISRPYLVKKLEAGEIPFTKVGKHRRVLLENIIAFKEQAKNNTEKSLRALADQAQEYNMGY